ncbi:MAG: dTDP-glucose 4,6-dehydratase [Gammaproteobacteria bacterium]
MILVTGGSGFIGSNFVLDWIACQNEPIIVLDKLTYAGNLNNLNSVKNNPLFTFFQGDINDKGLIETLLKTYSPRAILNFAAESHVDKSINNPDEFIRTNINGTFCLLEETRQHWNSLNSDDQSSFRFLQISTDEVYGSLGVNEAAFSETRAYSPNNPYSASKAAADHLVNAYHHTYQLPTLITNCSNNYGSYQFPEKLIPLTILNALQHQRLSIYGDGLQIRDWLHVSDHCSAIREVLSKATPGQTYNIGGHCEKTNIDVVKTICSLLDKLKPKSDSSSYASLITHVKDRPGHDRRYAIDANKIYQDLGWLPKESFESGIQKTISWYLNNLDWISTINNNDNFQTWLELNYDDRG